MPAAKLEFVPASEFPVSELAELFTRSFAGYFVEVRDTPELLAQRLRIDSTDLHLSRVARIDSQPVAIILVSPRGNACRVSGMGVIESRRGTGIGRLLIEGCCQRLAALGFQRLILEVIEQNEVAESLYRSIGFNEQRRLVGFERPPRDPVSSAANSGARAGGGGCSKPSNADSRSAAGRFRHDYPHAWPTTSSASSAFITSRSASSKWNSISAPSIFADPTAHDRTYTARTRKPNDVPSPSTARRGPPTIPGPLRRDLHGHLYQDHRMARVGRLELGHSSR